MFCTAAMQKLQQRALQYRMTREVASYVHRDCTFDCRLASKGFMVSASEARPVDIGSTTVAMVRFPNNLPGVIESPVASLFALVAMVDCEADVGMPSNELLTRNGHIVRAHCGLEEFPSLASMRSFEASTVTYMGLTYKAADILNQ